LHCQKRTVSRGNATERPCRRCVAAWREGHQILREKRQNREPTAASGTAPRSPRDPAIDRVEPCVSAGLTGNSARVHARQPGVVGRFSTARVCVRRAIRTDKFRPWCRLLTIFNGAPFSLYTSPQIVIHLFQQLDGRASQASLVFRQRPETGVAEGETAGWRISRRSVRWP
jgi:hypothetical protein